MNQYLFITIGRTFVNFENFSNMQRGIVTNTETIEMIKIRFATIE